MKGIVEIVYGSYHQLLLQENGKAWTNQWWTEGHSGNFLIVLFSCVSLFLLDIITITTTNKNVLYSIFYITLSYTTVLWGNGQCLEEVLSLKQCPQHTCFGITWVT